MTEQLTPVGGGDAEDTMRNELVEVERELRKATSDYEVRRVQAEQARSLEVAALNALNIAQRRFDAVCATLRKAAPRDTDWHRGFAQ